MTSPKLDLLQDKVTGFLLELGLPPECHAPLAYAYRYDDTVVLVSLIETDEGAWVRLASTLLKEFRPNLELVTRVLRLNTEVVMGAFLIFEDDTLTFSITLPAAGLELEGFCAAMDQVARVSNQHGEELRALAGGRLAVDILPH